MFETELFISLLCCIVLNHQAVLLSYFVLDRPSTPPSDRKKALPRMYQDNRSPKMEDPDDEERDAKLTQPYFRRDFDDRPSSRSGSRERYRRSPSSPPPDEKPPSSEHSAKSNRSPRRYFLALLLVKFIFIFIVTDDARYFNPK